MVRPRRTSKLIMARMPHRTHVLLLPLLLLLAGPGPGGQGPGVHAQLAAKPTRGPHPASPCPDVFSYEGREPERNRWQGVVLVKTQEPLEGLRLNVKLTHRAQNFGNDVGETSSSDNVDFTILNLKLKLEPGPPKPVKIFTAFGDRDDIPYVDTIKMNGRTICTVAHEEGATRPSSKPMTSRPSCNQKGQCYVPGGTGGSRPSNTRPQPPPQQPATQPQQQPPPQREYPAAQEPRPTAPRPAPTRPVTTPRPSPVFVRPEEYSPPNSVQQNETPAPKKPQPVVEEEYYPAKFSPSATTERGAYSPPRTTTARYRPPPPMHEEPTSKIPVEVNNNHNQNQAFNQGLGLNQGGGSINQDLDQGFVPESSSNANQGFTGQNSGNYNYNYNTGGSSSGIIPGETVNHSREERPRPTRQANCGRIASRPSPLIVHGETSLPGKWPWHVALYQPSGRDWKYQCGGTLISPTVVVTAAHCVVRKGSGRPLNPDSILVFLGKHKLAAGSEDGVQDKHVYDIHVHPQYNYTTYRNDIAVLALSSPADMTDIVRPACLWDPDRTDLSYVENKFGTVVGWRTEWSSADDHEKVVGWGIESDGLLTEELHQAQMPVVSSTACVYSYPTFFSQYTNEMTYCAGFKPDQLGAGTSVCNGDSGGGMFFKNDENLSDEEATWMLRGLVSLSVRKENDRCDPSHFVIFTDVAKYRDWLQAYLP